MEKDSCFVVYVSVFVCAVEVPFDGVVGSVCYFVVVFSECVDNSVCVRVVAVSYTHLDVYKRQI